MAQEVFLRAYRSLAKWRRQAVFSTWLFALATNLYRNELKRVPPLMMQLNEVAEPPDSRSWGASMEEKAYSETIRRAVIALPAKYRDAIVLFYFHEMNISEAARSLGLPEGTVKIRLSRARTILRKKMSRTIAAGYLREA